MTKILTTAIVLGVALLMGCGGGTKEAAQPTALATSAAPTAVPVKATAVPVAPTAAPQDSVLYTACVLTYGDLTGDAAWVKCLCAYLDKNYTMEQFTVGKTFTPEEAAEIERLCGQPSDLQ